MTGFSLRPFTWADLPAVTDIYNDTRKRANDLRTYTDIQFKNMRLSTLNDTLSLEDVNIVAVSIDGEVIGIANLFVEADFTDIFAEITVKEGASEGGAVENALLGWFETQALKLVQQHATHRQLKQSIGLYERQKALHKAVEEHGYTFLRGYYRMQIPLYQPIQELPFPPQLQIRPMQTSDARPVFEADQLAFSTVSGMTPASFEEWKRDFIETSDFQPRYMIAAWDGDQVAGSCLGREMGAEGHERIGYIRHLSITPTWRGKGLAQALLHYVLRAFQDEHLKLAGLGVATDNEPAIQLYNKAGMSPASQQLIYQKEILF